MHHAAPERRMTTVAEHRLPQNDPASVPAKEAETPAGPQAERRAGLPRADRPSDRESARRDDAARGLDEREVPGESIARLAEVRLFSRATEGDRTAMEAVWRANRGWLAGVVAAHAPRGADVEDLLQEVAATFVAKSREVRDALSLRGWLRTVAVNAARIAARSQRIERRSLAQVAHALPGMRAERPDAILSGTRKAGGIEAERVEAERVEAEELLALLREIPAIYAEPLLLQAVRGLSQRGIAELLEVPETTVETRLARGRRMLRAVAAEREGRSDSQGRDPQRADARSAESRSADSRSSESRSVSPGSSESKGPGREGDAPRSMR